MRRGLVCNGDIGKMLRAAKSLPNLRQSSKSFASQALFSERSAASYRNFKSGSITSVVPFVLHKGPRLTMFHFHSVTQLKAELKTRGLAV